MTPRIQKAIDIFLDAINNGTLAKGTCTACAVGNLVAAGANTPIIKQEYGWYDCKYDNTYWKYLIFTGWQHSVNNEALAADNISKTDFSVEELRKIEQAFEDNTLINHEVYCYHSYAKIRRDQIRGLEAVVKVMLEFDEQLDNVEEVFTNKAELIPV